MRHRRSDRTCLLHAVAAAVFKKEVFFFPSFFLLVARNNTLCLWSRSNLKLWRIFSLKLASYYISSKMVKKSYFTCNPLTSSAKVGAYEEIIKM